ncbi:hypothetical protein [Dactylosporangium sp. CA-092794]|uniref:hypothetical protein n=1 Tax=Dactylosporangium sp. CA-092794 TaxID=3239929 RepID=UPI003D928C1E
MDRLATARDDEEDDRLDGERIEEYGKYVVDSPWAWLPQPSRGVVMPGRPWRDAPIRPIMLALPTGRGYTIRGHFQDPEEFLFLDRDSRPLLFRSVDGLARHLEADDHFLVEIEDWSQVKDWFINLVLTPDPDDQIDLEIIPHVLKLSPQDWIPELLVAGRNLAAEFATVFDLTDAVRLLAPGSRLDQLDDVMRLAQRSLTGWSARRRRRNIDTISVVRDWNRVLDSIDQMTLWED